MLLKNSPPLQEVIEQLLPESILTSSMISWVCILQDVIEQLLPESHEEATRQTAQALLAAGD